MTWTMVVSSWTTYCNMAMVKKWRPSSIFSYCFYKTWLNWLITQQHQQYLGLNECFCVKSFQPMLLLKINYLNLINATILHSNHVFLFDFFYFCSLLFDSKVHSFHGNRISTGLSGAVSTLAFHVCWFICGRTYDDSWHMSYRTNDDGLQFSRDWKCINPGAATRFFVCLMANEIFGMGCFLFAAAYQ